MKFFTSVAAAACIASSAAFSETEQDIAVALAALEVRALPNAPDGYTPAAVDCPSTRPSIRLANSLSQGEQDFLKARRNVTIPAMQDFLKRANINGFDVDSYFSGHSSNTSMLPNIGIAVSGGGYRALLNGAGAIQAFDSRENNSTATGHLGGLLQSATYLAGLSGGSWLVGSIMANNFSSISDLLSSYGSQWEFQNSIFKGPDRGIQILSSADYYTTIYNEVQGKTTNFSTTITDYWGRALSFQLVNASDGGPSYTWSSIANQPGFSTGDQPFPIAVSDSRRPNELLISSNSSIYEFNPYEMGTWDASVYGFAPMEYVGSNFTNGTLPDNETCVRGFDNAGFVMGTSSTLFNEFLLNINSTNAPQVFVSAIESILKDISSANDDISSWDPSPFYGWDPTGRSHIVDEKELTLVDGGEDNQNIPFHPLIQPVRNVDVILAVDSSADTSLNWPNGSSLVATYERSLNATVANGTSFPFVPDTQTFIDLGLNARPTFFGCNASNQTGSTPLVVYLPNSPYVWFSNTSTFQDSYNTSERDAMVANGNAVVTQANSSVDPQWPACIACAVLERSFGRTGQSVPSQCTDCYSRYCWNGSTDNAANGYAPGLKNASAATNGASMAFGTGAASAGVWSSIVLAAITLAAFM